METTCLFSSQRRMAPRTCHCLDTVHQGPTGFPLGSTRCPRYLLYEGRQRTTAVNDRSEQLCVW